MISSIPSATIQEAKDRAKADMLTIISEHVNLKKRGANYVGCCPFHKENSGSFSVNPEKKIIKCFGCGWSGDVVSFLMKKEGDDFIHCILKLIQRYNIYYTI